MNSRANTSKRLCHRALALVALMIVLTVASTRLRADTGTCAGASFTLPFTDVPAANGFFCQIAAAYFSGLTNGTSATTYSPGNVVTREQMAAFITRTMDQSLKRGSRRAALRQFWITQGADDLALTTVGSTPILVESDGADLWVANYESNTVSRVRASDGKLLGTWSGATHAIGVLVAMGKVFVTGATNPGSLYQIDPTQPAGAVTMFSNALVDSPRGIAYDGQRIWTANIGGSISIVTLNPTTVTTLRAGFSSPIGILFDGTNIWVTDQGNHLLKKLDANGAVLQSISMGSNAQPLQPVFDGTNIWVPNARADTITVVRAASGTMLATLSGNGLNNPVHAAFDGERILVTNRVGESVSLWKAADFTPIGTFSTGADTNPIGACSDGLNFWITLNLPGVAGKLARF